MAALEQVCSSAPDRAALALGLGPTQADDVTANTTLRTRPCAAAMRVYTGVLYDALDYATLDASARRRAASRLAITSALWGLLRPMDRVPSYRLSAGVSLPGLGAVNAAWRPPLDEVLAGQTGLVIDLRSGAYTAMGRVPATRASVTVRVLQERAGRRMVVSHHNKATKGRLARLLLEEPNAPRRAPEVAEVLAAAGHVIESTLDQNGAARLDVVVHDL
jgi:cytoplasmic iron level regulating protein YaaA (DUF328/UPF0246 family)